MYYFRKSKGKISPFTFTAVIDFLSINNCIAYLVCKIMRINELILQ